MLVITTPTGTVGAPLLAQLAEGPEPLRVIVRDPSKLADHLRERVEVVTGSHDDPAVLAEALAGADQLFWLVPPDPRSASALEHYRAFTEPACAAVQSAGVRRVVAVSSLGGDFQGPSGLLAGAFLMDDLLKATGVAYRSLAMPFFMENLLAQAGAIRDAGSFFTANALDQRLLLVAAADIADHAAALLRDASWNDQASVPVISPDELTPTQMAKVATDAIGLPVAAKAITIDALKERMLGFGAAPGYAQDMAAMVTAQNAGIYEPGRRAAQPTGTTSFSAWCEGVLKPAVLAAERPS